MLERQIGVVIAHFFTTVLIEIGRGNEIPLAGGSEEIFSSLSVLSDAGDE